MLPFNIHNVSREIIDNVLKSFLIPFFFFFFFQRSHRDYNLIFIFFQTEIVIKKKKNDCLMKFVLSFSN